jgi:hypothetical protein
MEGYPMIVMTRSIYPPARAVEMSKRFIKAGTNPFPPFMKRLYVLTSAVGAEGVEVVSLYDVEDARMPDAYKEFVKYFSQYFDVEGYRYEFKPMMTAQETIPLILPK